MEPGQITCDLNAAHRREDQAAAYYGARVLDSDGKCICVHDAASADEPACKMELQ